MHRLHLVGNARAHEVFPELLGRHRAVANLQPRLHAVHEVHGTKRKVADSDQHRSQEHVARGAAVDDGHQREYAQDDAKHRARDAKGALLEQVRHDSANERQVDHHGGKSGVTNSVMQHDDQHQSDDTSRNKSDVGRSARRVQLARDQSHDQNPRETRSGAVVAKNRLVSRQQRRGVDVHLVGPGANHRAEDHRAERDHDQSSNRNDEATGHVLQPQRERGSLQNSVPAVVVPVAVDNPLLVVDLGGRTDVEHQQQEHRNDCHHHLHAERHLDTDDVQRHEDDVAGDPPDRAVLGVDPNELGEVRGDTRGSNGSRHHHLEAFSNTGEEGRRLANTVQCEHVGASTVRNSGRQLSDGERQQHVLHRDDRKQDEQTVKARDQRRLPAEEVATDNSADTQRPKVRGLGVALDTLAFNGRAVDTQVRDAIHPERLLGTRSAEVSEVDRCSAHPPPSRPDFQVYDLSSPGAAAGQDTAGLSSGAQNEQCASVRGGKTASVRGRGQRLQPVQRGARRDRAVIGRAGCVGTRPLANRPAVSARNAKTARKSNRD
ncbi:hypothetical protein ON010_g12331 [Phytophthora cinnamomi]|nr:hypothetical protein ON010_g12331 [Phytophthora cinnamomi]